MILTIIRSAGLFVWVDIRRSMSGVAQSSGTTSKVSNGQQDTEHWENQIVDICQRNGVMIAPGHAYGAEECGWVRITFTVEEDALIAGLCRLGESLDELETSTNF